MGKPKTKVVKTKRTVATPLQKKQKDTVLSQGVQDAISHAISSQLAVVTAQITEQVNLAVANVSASATQTAGEVDNIPASTSHVTHNEAEVVDSMTSNSESLQNVVQAMLNTQSAGQPFTSLDTFGNSQI